MTELSVRCTWHVVGAVTRSSSGDAAQLLLPVDLREHPGVYRMLIDGPGRNELYVGETDRLRRRGRQYRQGNASQKTSRWVHEHLHLRLGAGAVVVMEIAIAAGYRIGDGPWLATDLSLKEHRLLLENATIVEALAAGERLILNRVAAGRE